jgi:hypothetical protein
MHDTKRRRRSLIPAQGSSIARTLGGLNTSRLNPEKGSAVGERFQRFEITLQVTQGCRQAPTTGLALANAFGVDSD